MSLHKLPQWHRIPYETVTHFIVITSKPHSLFPKNGHTKVCGPYLVIFLDHACFFEYYVVGCGFKNEKMPYKDKSTYLKFLKYSELNSQHKLGNLVVQLKNQHICIFYYHILN